MKQALHETLARLASRENLDALLAQVVSKSAAAPRPAPRLPNPPAPYQMLTMREREILRCIAHGHGNKAIARTFDLSVHTVKRHVANIRHRCGGRGPSFPDGFPTNFFSVTLAAAGAHLLRMNSPPRG